MGLDMDCGAGDGVIANPAFMLDVRRGHARAGEGHLDLGEELLVAEGGLGEIDEEVLGVDLAAHPSSRTRTSAGRDYRGLVVGRVAMGQVASDGRQVADDRIGDDRAVSTRTGSRSLQAAPTARARTRR